MVDDSQVKEDIAENYLIDLRSEYINNLDHKSSLDNKANSMITISVTSTTLLIGITTFLTSKIQSSQIQYDTYRKDKIEEIRKMSKPEFIEHRIEDYLLCVKNNTEMSNKKSNDIIRGQICFIISVSIFSVFLITLLINVIMHTVVITHF